jgi:hypothetical protein
VDPHAADNDAVVACDIRCCGHKLLIIQRRQVWGIRSALRADICKEPLRGTLDRPPPSAPAAQTPLLAKEGNGGVSILFGQGTHPERESIFWLHIPKSVSIYFEEGDKPQSPIKELRIKLALG